MGQPLTFKPFMKHSSTLLALFFCVLFVLGCGKGATVKGKVAFSDGTPLTVGEVVFQTDTYAASGRIQPDGSYKLSGATQKEGVPPGRYGVKVINAFDSSNTPPGTHPNDAKPPIPLINATFEKTETSGLTCEVKGTTMFDITVTKPSSK